MSKPPQRPPTKRGRALSRAEIVVWRWVLQDRGPLPGRGVPGGAGGAPPAAGAAAAARAKPSKTGHRRAPARPAAPAAPAKTAQAPLEIGRAVGIDKRQAERLRRGRTEIDARIDLHGMTQAEAHRRLDAFIHASIKAGRRCVLVITGKGLTPKGSMAEMSGRGAGVLRAAVPRWLNELPLRGHVIAVSHAQPKDGGHGALYVLLKRPKGD